MLRFWLVPGDLVLSGLRRSAFTELQQNVSLFIWDAASNKVQKESKQKSQTAGVHRRKHRKPCDEDGGEDRATYTRGGAESAEGMRCRCGESRQSPKGSKTQTSSPSK